MKKKIFVTGACGYIGTILVKKLLNNNYKVIAYDTQWFGNYLIKHNNLKIIRGDTREIKNINFKNVYAIIHLASIANDPCSELNPKLAWETSCLSTLNLCEIALKNKIKRIKTIYVWPIRRRKKRQSIYKPV